MSKCKPFLFEEKSAARGTKKPVALVDKATKEPAFNKQHKETYFKDLPEFKNKDYVKLLDMLPFWLCKISKDYDGKPKYESIYIVGINKESLIASKYNSYDAEDGSPFGHYFEELETLLFKDINKSYVLSKDCTKAQLDFLDKYTDNDTVICRHEASHIIADVIEGWHQRNNYEERRYYGGDDDEWDDAPMSFEECC